MPDTIRTLDYFQNVSTGAFKDANNITAQQQRDFLVSVYHIDHSADISVTTTATATIGRWHVCTGTTADYTVTLPAASGNAGKLIGLRMSSALTKLVTIDANASETIDGALTKVMWANEVAVLFCDGTSWTKIAGKSIPLSLMLQRSSVTGNQSFSASTWTACLTPEVVFGTSLMDDTTNDRIKIVRAGKYSCSATFYVSATGITFAYGTVGRNQPENTLTIATIQASSTIGAGASAAVFDCNVNDYLVASAIVGGTSPIFDTGSITAITAIEMLEW